MYKVRRMLPPGVLNYYYMVGGEKVVLDARETTDVHVDTAKDVRVHAKYDGKCTVPRTNIIRNMTQRKEVVTERFLVTMGVVPRPAPYQLKGRKRLKTPWDFFKSVFKAYRVDNDRLLDQCFEIDWPQTKCERFIGARNPADVGAIKAYLKSVYKHIREAYKYYAGV